MYCCSKDPAAFMDAHQVNYATSFCWIGIITRNWRTFQQSPFWVGKKNIFQLYYFWPLCSDSSDVQISVFRFEDSASVWSLYGREQFYDQGKHIWYWRLEGMQEFPSYVCFSLCLSALDGDALRRWLQHCNPMVIEALPGSFSLAPKFQHKLFNLRTEQLQTERCKTRNCSSSYWGNQLRTLCQCIGAKPLFNSKAIFIQSYQC